MRCAVGIAFQGDGGHGDDGRRGEPLSPGRRTWARHRPVPAASGSYGSRWRRDRGCRTPWRCARRWRRRTSILARPVARSAWRSRAGSGRSRFGRARWRSRTDTTTASSAAGGNGVLLGLLAADQVAAHRDQAFARVPARGRRRCRPCVRPSQSRRRSPCSIFSASISAMMSTASAACWPLRRCLSERKRVLP